MPDALICGGCIGIFLVSSELPFFYNTGPEFNMDLFYTKSAVFSLDMFGFKTLMLLV